MAADEPLPEPPSWDKAISRRLDLRNLACPLPVLMTRKALRGMARGDRLVVEATDDMAVIDLPHCCAEDGHRLLAQETREGVHRFLIERQGPTPSAP